MNHKTATLSILSTVLSSTSLLAEASDNSTIDSITFAVAGEASITNVFLKGFTPPSLDQIDIIDINNCPDTRQGLMPDNEKPVTVYRCTREGIEILVKNQQCPDHVTKIPNPRLLGFIPIGFAKGPFVGLKTDCVDSEALDSNGNKYPVAVILEIARSGTAPLTDENFFINLSSTQNSASEPDGLKISHPLLIDCQESNLACQEAKLASQTTTTATQPDNDQTNGYSRSEEKCNELVASGNYGRNQRFSLFVGKGNSVVLKYEAYSVPDSFRVEDINWNILYDTGYVGSGPMEVYDPMLSAQSLSAMSSRNGNGEVTVLKPHDDQSVVVIVDAPLAGTAWSLKVSCAKDGSSFGNSVRTNTNRNQTSGLYFGFEAMGTLQPLDSNGLNEATWGGANYFVGTGGFELGYRLALGMLDLGIGVTARGGVEGISYFSTENPVTDYAGTQLYPHAVNYRFSWKPAITATARLNLGSLNPYLRIGTPNFADFGANDPITAGVVSANGSDQVILSGPYQGDPTLPVGLGVDLGKRRCKGRVGFGIDIPLPNQSGLSTNNVSPSLSVGFNCGL